MTIELDQSSVHKKYLIILLSPDTLQEHQYIDNFLFG